MLREKTRDGCSCGAATNNNGIGELRKRTCSRWILFSHHLSHTLSKRAAPSRLQLRVILQMNKPIDPNG